MKEYRVTVRRRNEEGKTEESVFKLKPVSTWGGEEPEIQEPE